MFVAFAENRDRRSWTLSLLVGLAGLGLLLTGCSSSPEPAPSPTASGQGEVFLEAKGDSGPDPFTDSTVGDFEDSRDSPSASPSQASPSPSSDSSDGIQSTVGTTNELYGGSGDQTICDTSKLKQFLQGDAEKASAWAGVLGVEVANIPTYIDALAPVVLDNDIRVTNHGFADGRATPRQSVLEAGTAVLVDNTGVPRVRCACGNPLLEPVATPVAPTYVGTAWPAFNPTIVIVIVPGTVVQRLIVINIRSGKPIEIKVGGDGPVATQTPTANPSATATGTTSPGDPNANYTSCARRYGELVVQMQVSGVEPSAAQLERWSSEAEAAAVLARDNDLAGARAKICGTVAEMEELLGS